MDGNRRISIIVGAFVIAGLAALALTILSLSSQQGVFRDRYRLVAYFENVQGLLANAPVWLAGRQVGRVESVGFSPEGSGRPALRGRSWADGGRTRRALTGWARASAPSRKRARRTRR